MPLEVRLDGIVDSIVLIKSTLVIRVLLILVFRTDHMVSGRRRVKGYKALGVILIFINKVYIKYKIILLYILTNININT